ncbi:MAG: alpha/beta fold hydrolase [Anaerolineae bacterium]|nr:alpha/beta fold hydrolase [Anaerolineae bacterium]
MPTVAVNGIDIYYEEQGDGEPLLLITGLSYPLWYWHRVVPLLAAHFRVITFDNRGVGATDKPPGPYSASMMAADTAGVLDALALERAHILGHSMGGYIAQALAVEQPQRIDRLILASTSFGGPDQIAPSPEAMAVLTDLSGDPAERFMRGLTVSAAPGFAAREPAFVQEWLQYRIDNPVDPIAYQAQLAVGLALFAREAAFDGKLQQITAPTLLLWGEHDQVTPPGNAQLMAAQIPNTAITILADAGHNFALEVPEAAAEAVISFLAGRRSGGKLLGGEPS